MIEMLLAAALVWPADCEKIGKIYHDAAAVRDVGWPLEVVVRMTKYQQLKRALYHVYERPDMTADQWRWFAIGICVGTPDDEPKTSGRMKREIGFTE